MVENGGEREIRTLGTLTRTPVFETGAFNHSATSPTGSFTPYHTNLQGTAFTI
jgi:hypothetical protein